MPATNGAAHGVTNGDSTVPRLWVTGIASHFPPYSLDSERLESIAARFHDVKSPGIKNLLEISRKTTIQKRPSAIPYDNGFGCQAELPDMTAIDAFFRQAGVDMAVCACRKAMRESGCTAADITHTVAVTATNHGCPGYDVLVASKLSLPPIVDSTLLQGVGCSGGLALMRAAANVAAAAAARNRPARVLAYTCEICTAMLRYDLAAAESTADMSALSPAATMLSDGAAAFVLCNDLGSEGLARGTDGEFLQLLEWKNTVVPHTHADVGFFADPNGYRTILGQGVVANHIKNAIELMLPDMLASCHEAVGIAELSPSDFDWALHPGSPVIVDGIKEMLELEDDHVLVTNEVYKSKGNSGSVSVLAVLCQMLSKGPWRDHIISAAYGPGINVEMVVLKRCPRSDSDSD